MLMELDVEVGMDMAVVWVAVPVVVIVIWDMSIMANSTGNRCLVLDGTEGCR